MFNSKLKKESISRLETMTNRYESTVKRMEKNSINLFEARQKAAELIGQIESYINTLANTPKKFENEIEKIKINTSKFNSIFEIKVEDRKNQKISGGVAGAGALAGVGVAAGAPTAAMAIATTFGTASTGAAISGLSGAAATNAALAWLGGGALTASGGGMAAGNALLAMAGPVGWAIGGTALAGGGLLASNKNKKVAKKAHSQSIEIEKQAAKIRAIITEIKEIEKLTSEHINGLDTQVNILKDNAPDDYNYFTVEQKEEIGSMINNTLSLSKLLNRTVGSRNG